MLEQIVRGPLLVPRDGGRVDYIADGVLATDAGGVLRFVGPWAELERQLPAGAAAASAAATFRWADGVMLPPLLDIHTHIPQHPIRGRFIEGVPADAPGGRLLAGLKRNVFPAEAGCDDRACATGVVEQFRADTLAAGVVGGMAYMTPSASATEIALELLPETWSVGLVLMNQNCPENLRTEEATLEQDVARLARRFGRRLVVTDRFAVAVTTPLRRRGAALAREFGLRTQTHLNEQVQEKQLIERTMYPDAGSYANVYRRDGLLDHACVAAHCIQMRDEEWRVLRDTGTTIAHCPTSNLLLGSGTMPLDRVMAHGLPYSIATDVGASPTVSMLAEIGRFLAVHAGHSDHATAAEGLYRATRAPAEQLGIEAVCGRLEAGRPMSFVEVRHAVTLPPGASVDAVIRLLVPADLDDPLPSVRRVTVRGVTAFEAGAQTVGHAERAASV